MDVSEKADYERAATGYLVWPLAVFALLREAPTASSWVRIHTRQAAVFGIVASVFYLVLLALPLLVVIAYPAISTGTTVLVYAVGLLADALVFLVLAAVTLVYSSRASRGELFAIPLMSGLTDAVFRLKR